MTSAVPRRRRGTSLVELLIALPLMAVATGCALLLLVQTAAEHRAYRDAYSRARERRQARAVLAAEIAPLRARDLHTVTDTLLAVRGQQGVATVCANDSTTIDVAAPVGSLSTAWLDAIDVGDAVLAWTEADSVGAAPQETSATLVGIAHRLGAGPCGAAVVPQRWQLRTSGFVSAGATLAVGAPLIVQREVQYLHYRSNGRWWLGRRAWTGGRWETVQPVAGPLESPANAGLSLRGLTSRQTRTSVTDSIAAVRLTVRTLVLPPIGPSGAPRRLVLPADSLVSELPLRAESWSRGGP